jgi:hypothetical protein
LRSVNAAGVVKCLIEALQFVRKVAALTGNSSPLSAALSYQLDLSCLRIVNAADDFEFLLVNRLA